MRIEIGSGGAGVISASAFQVNLNSYISKADEVISSFKAVTNSISQLNGGTGNLEAASDELNIRIGQEVQKRDHAKNIQTASNQFLDLAKQTDSSVASIITKNQKELYTNYPKLDTRPASDEEKNWLENAWDWIKGKGKEIKDSVSDAWNAIVDTGKKLWNSAVDFYNAHKKVIDTILLIVGTIGTIVGVIATSGGALVALLATLGLSMEVATFISIAIGVLTIVSSVASSALEITDIWAEIDDPVFNAFQKWIGIADKAFGNIYEIGKIFNSITGVKPDEFIKRQKAIENGKKGYGNLAEQHLRVKIEEGRKYSMTQKNAIYGENIRRNNGELRDDLTGKKLQRYKPGSKKPINGSEIDHKLAKNNGGPNSWDNARIVNWETNRAKSDIIDFPLDKSVGGPQDYANISNLVGHLSNRTGYVLVRSSLGSGGR